MPVALPIEGSETHRGGKAKEALSCRIGLHSSRFHGTPPSAGPGGILPAASGSGGKERARRNSGTEKLGDNHAPGYIDRAFECCSSPRAAVRIARQCQSPRARCRSVQWVEPCYAQEPQEASEPGTPGCPKTPMHSQTPALIQEILLSPGGDASPTAVALFQKHFTASPGFAQNWSPSRGQSSPSLGAGCRSSRRDKSRLGCPSAPGHLDDPASPTAVALFQQYFAPSPGFFNQAQKLLAGDSTPASPGGFAKAQRRPVLGPRYCIQPMNSPLSEAGTPTAGDPSPFIFRSASKSEAQDESPFIFRSACKSVAGGHAVQFADGESSTTPSPQEDRPRSRRHLFGNGGSTATALDFGGDNPFTPHRFIQQGRPSPAPSSVGSIPIDYDEDEYGYDRDIDYERFRELERAIPQPNFSVSKPARPEILDLCGGETKPFSSSPPPIRGRLFDEHDAQHHRWASPGARSSGRDSRTSSKEADQQKIGRSRFKPATLKHLEEESEPVMFHRYLGALGPLPTLNEDKEHSGNTKPHPVQEYIWRTMADNNPQQVRRPLSGPPSHVAEGRRCNSSGQGSKDRLGSAPRESLELPRQDIGRQDSGFAPVQPPGDPPQRPNLRRPSSSNAAFRPSSRQQHPPSRNEQPSQSRNALRPSGAPSLGLVGRSLSFNSAQERPINRPLAPLESNGRPLVQPSFLPRIKTPQATTEPLAAPSESSRVPSFPDIHQKPAVARGRFVRDLKR